MNSRVPDSFVPADDGDRETYSYGQCMWFALAVHDRTGWPLEVLCEPNGPIAHAFVRLPDGRSFDVCGPNGADDFLQFAPGQSQRVAREELIALAGGLEDTEAVAKAGRIFEAMLGEPRATRRPKP